ncbi:MAG TPA: hypothetical protein VHL57_03120, partial [Flavobacteriales bacterium]|nr:hypothetical protein [Flavobacteriales bacterium]
MRPHLSHFVLFFTLIGTVANAQVPEWQWARSGVGEEFDQASAVCTDAAGNVFVAGYFASDSITFGAITLHNNTPGFDDLFVVKYDPAGTVLWARSHGGNFDDKAFALATDAAGNLLMTGYFYSATILFGTTTLTNAGAVGDICVVKYDPSGNVVWALREGGPGLEIPYAIAVNAAGSFVVAGRFSSNSITFGSTTLLQAGSMDVFVVRYDPFGNVLWAQGAGGGTNDEAYALALNTGGDVIVAGYYTQEADFGPFTLPNAGQANIFLAQCDGSTGTFEWAKATANAGDERAMAIALDDADNIYAAGFFQGDSLVVGNTTLYSTDIDNGWLARFDADGDAVWAHGTNARSKAQGVVVANNAVYTCGVFREDAFAYANDVLTLAGASDLFLLKSDLNGNAQWAAQQTGGGESGESALAMAANPAGDLVIAGTFDSDVTTFGPAQLTVSDGYDAFVLKTGDGDVGIRDVDPTDAITLAPNPSSGSFYLDGLAGTGRIEIHNAVGVLVHTVRVPAQQQR